MLKDEPEFSADYGISRNEKCRPAPFFHSRYRFQN